MRCDLDWSGSYLQTAIRQIFTRENEDKVIQGKLFQKQYCIIQTGVCTTSGTRIGPPMGLYGNVDYCKFTPKVINVCEARIYLAIFATTFKSQK